MTDAPTELATPVSAAVATSGRHRWDLDVLRILAILGVIAIHVYGLILGHPELKGTPTWTFGLTLDYATRWCVPLFVMISGALVLAPRAHAAGPAAFLRRRVVRLLPALVVWHLVYLFLIRAWLRGLPLEPTAVLMNLIDAQVYTALYFLWLILGLYLVAPVLAAFLREGGHARAVWVAVVAMAWSLVVSALPGVTGQLGYPRPRSEGALTMWLLYVGLFVAGWAWHEARPTSRRWMWAGPLAVMMMAQVVWQVSVAPDQRWLQVLVPPGYTGLAVVVAALSLFVFGIDVLSKFRPPARLQRWVRTLAEATFGVFLCHLVVIAVIQHRLPDWYDDPSPVAKTEMYVVVVLVAFTISVVARRVPVLRRVF